MRVCDGDTIRIAFHLGVVCGLFIGIAITCLSAILLYPRDKGSH